MGWSLNAESKIEVFRVADIQGSFDSSVNDEGLRARLESLPDKKKFKHEKYFTGDPLFELFFAGSGSAISYCLGIGRWRQMPYFSLLDFRNIGVERTFSRRDREVLNDLFAHALEFMHREGRYTFFYATRVRPFPVKRIRTAGEMAPVRGVSVFDRYDFTIEAEVLKGEEPHYPYQQSLIRLNDRAFDYWVKRGTLKMSHLAGYFPSLSI